MGSREADRPWAPRWDGRPGRTEVWYTTLTDPTTRTGVWLHHELVAPTDGSPARVHGWIALFPPEGPVEHARFGPEPWPPRRPFSSASASASDAASASAAAADAGARHLRGTAGPYTWDLTEHPAGEPLYTFPRWAWHHGGLPAAQMLPAAASRYTGTIDRPGGVLHLDGALGATARIHGHGNAERWAWLHADLGHGDVLEIVAAVSRKPVLDRLPPLVFLRLRHRGRTWPRTALRPAVGWARGPVQGAPRSADLDGHRPDPAAPGPRHGHPAGGTHPGPGVHRPGRQSRGVPQQRGRRRRDRARTLVGPLAPADVLDPGRNRARRGGRPVRWGRRPGRRGLDGPSATGLTPDRRPGHPATAAQERGDRCRCRPRPSNAGPWSTCWPTDCARTS
ncbi:hypothetical protein ACFQ1I_45670 [Kitasatospora arboriphila]